MLKHDFNTFDFQSKEKLNKEEIEKLKDFFKRYDEFEDLLHSNYKSKGKVIMLLGIPLYMIISDEDSVELEDLMKEIGENVQYYYNSDYYWILK